MKKAVIMAAAVLWISFHSANAANLLGNGSFETGAFPPWMVFSGSAVIVTGSSADVTDGADSAELDPGQVAGFGEIVQSFLTDPGTSYILQ